MTDTDTKPKVGWTDREILAYLLSLVEHSGGRLDIKNSPRPAGRTVCACEQKIGGLKNMLKAELKALRASKPINTGNAMPTPKKNAGARKRKGGDDVDGSPKKRGGGKKKVEVEKEVEDEEELEDGFKVEIKRERGFKDEV